MRCWMEIAEGHGLRRAEALRLCPAQHSEQDNTITYRTKGELTNTLPVSPDLLAYFEMVKPVVDPNTSLIDLIAGRHITHDIFYKAWQQLKAKAKVNPQLRPHDMRRTLAQRAYHETKKDILAVQKLLGHESLMSTLLYLRSADPQNLGPLIDRLSADNRYRWKN
jgi:integrase